MNNISIPKTVEAQMVHFSNLLRSIDLIGENSATMLYRNNIRNNIHEVLNKTFPLLSNELNNERKNEIVNNFFLKHCAKEAEFHKIATELVCFLQNNNFLDAALKCLMEYEWIIYNIEIAETIGMTDTKKQYYHTEMLGTEVRLNPTLKFIKLPFPLQNGYPSTGQYEHDGCFIYGLFKNSKNEVLRKKILSFDLSVLNLIIDNGISLIEDLGKYLLDDNKESLHKWISENVVNEFIYIN